MMLSLGNSVKFAHIEQLQLRVEMTTDVYLMANAKIKVDDGEFALPTVHQGKKRGMEHLDA